MRVTNILLLCRWFFRLLLVGGAGCVLMYAQAEGHLEGALEAVSEVATAVGEKFSGSSGASGAYNLMSADGSPAYKPHTHDGL